MSSGSGPMGLVAGSGAFPLAFARAVRASGRELVAVAHEGETDREIDELATHVTWLKLGQVRRLIDALESRGVREAVLLGGVTKASYFAGVRPDLWGLRMLAQVAVRSDDNLLRAIARELEAHGIAIVPSTPYLGELRAPEGVLGRCRPTGEQLSDVRYGFDLAKGLGKFDVGQTVVVKERAPLALEAIEGTDACIARGADLAHEGAVVVKVVKPGQDERFDLPAAGSGTVRVCLKHKVSVLAVEAGGTLLADRDEMIRLADKGGLVVLGVGPSA